MCSGATPRNKVPYWVQNVWVNVRLGHQLRETLESEGWGHKGERRLREREEHTSGIICNSLRALLHHFIQHLVKQDLFSFAFVLWNAGRSQFVGSFVKRWTASTASLQCHGAEKSFLTQLDGRWE